MPRREQIESIRPLGKRVLQIGVIDETRIIHPDFHPQVDLDALLEKLQFTDTDQVWLRAHNLDGVSRTAAPAVLGWTPRAVERVRKSVSRRLKRTKLAPPPEVEMYLGAPGRAYVETLATGRRIWALTPYSWVAEAIIRGEREKLFAKCPQNTVLMPLGRGPRMAEKKSFKFELKSLSETGRFSGWASIYGNVDAVGDVVDVGAFAKTIQEHGDQVPILWAHNSDEPIGIGTLTDSPHGLAVDAQLDLDVQAGKDAYSRLKKQIVKGLSIGFRTVTKAVVDGVRHLKEVRLYEVSLVLFPANELAQVTAVKARGQLTYEEKKRFLLSLSKDLDVAFAMLQVEMRVHRVLDDLQADVLHQLRRL